MKYLSIQKAAEKWDLSPRRVQQLCQSGQLSGARKEGRNWLIREDISYEGRRKKQKKEPRGENGRRPLPVGVSSYISAVKDYYYVDKTLLIRDFLDTIPKVSLFTRPRRFGKTLNMDMLRVFFEISEEDHSVFFRDKAIWACGESYRRHQGKYPVIALSFKDMKYANWAEEEKALRELLAAEFLRHPELEESSRLSRQSREYFRRIAEGRGDRVDFMSALGRLSEMLCAHHGREAVIIIDEYDTPIQQGFLNGFYEQSTAFMRTLFSAGLKDNPYLAFGFLTGILRVAKESIFSGMNNLVVNSLLSERYSSYFGFTEEEVHEMARYYGKTDKEEEIGAWYDGYRFGQTDIFNPWSVVNYFFEGCRPQAYWVSTSGNEIVGELLQEAGPDIRENLRKLMRGEAVLTCVDTDVIYPQVKGDPSSLYSFLLMTGYLKAESNRPQEDGNFMAWLKIPNKEISLVYSREILSRLMPQTLQPTAVRISRALFLGDLKDFQAGIEEYLLQTVSFFDTGGEAFYQGLILGLCAILNNRYRVESNREAGLGRFDIALIPLEKGLKGFLLELKLTRDKKVNLKKLAGEALGQVKRKRYAEFFREAEAAAPLCLGVAFRGKEVEMEAEEP